MYDWMRLKEDGNTLFFPNGEVNIPLLDDLLNDNEDKPSRNKVEVFRRVRIVAGKFPEYDEVLEKRSLRHLRNLYRRITGRGHNDKPIANHALPAIMVVGYNDGRLGSYVVDIGS